MNAAPPFDQSPIPFVGTVHRALVYRVHDGDTMWPIVDLGFGVAHANAEKGIRLVGPNGKGFNTPELNAADVPTRQAAVRARDRVMQLVLGKFVYVESWPPNADDKYGRWLMAVYPSSNLFVVSAAGLMPLSFMLNGVAVYDLATQLVAEGLGIWQEF